MHLYFSHLYQSVKRVYDWKRFEKTYTEVASRFRTVIVAHKSRSTDRRHEWLPGRRRKCGFV